MCGTDPTNLERTMRIELTPKRWQRFVLPLYYARIIRKRGRVSGHELEPRPGLPLSNVVHVMDWRNRTPVSGKAGVLPLN